MAIRSIRFLSQAGQYASIIFTSVFLAGLGASPPVIGFITAGFAAMMLASSHLFGILGDRVDRRLLLRWGSLASGLTLIGTALAGSVPYFTILRLFSGIALGVSMGSVIAFAADRKVLMGQFSAYGSLGWAAAGILTGSIGLFMSPFATAKAAFIFSGALLLAAFVFTFLLDDRPQSSLHVPLFPIALIKRNLSVYLPTLIRHGGAFGIWAFFPLILLGMGATPFIIGIIYTINPVIQTITMPLVDRFRATTAFLIGLILSAATFWMFWWAPSWEYLLLAHFPLGVAWAFLYVGALKYLTTRNREKSTVSGMFQSTLSASAIIGPLVGGLIMVFTTDYRVILLFAALMSTLAVVVYLLLARLKSSPSPG